MVTVQQFEQALLKEAQLLQNATAYRHQTAALSLQVLKTVQDVNSIFQ